MRKRIPTQIKFYYKRVLKCVVSMIGLRYEMKLFVKGQYNSFVPWIMLC